MSLSAAQLAVTYSCPEIHPGSELLLWALIANPKLLLQLVHAVLKVLHWSMPIGSQADPTFLKPSLQVSQEETPLVKL